MGNDNSAEGQSRLSQANPTPAATIEEAEVLRRGVRLGYFGRLPPFTPRQQKVFWLVTTAGFFNNYDGALLGLALKQIKNALRIPNASIGSMLSIVTLGQLPALLITPLADRYGRRTLLLYTVIAYTVFTALTALTWNAPSFVAMRFLAVMFSAAEGSVALVILVEEVDAGVRGWAVGMLAALSSVGYGVAALVFAAINVIPFGWRGLYALALIPLAIIIPLRRALPETRRFENTAHSVDRKTILGAFKALVVQHPGRFWLIASVTFLAPLGAASAGAFTSLYLQEAHNWTPANVSAMYFMGGGLGILGNIFAGRVSDRFGRRRMGAMFMFTAPLFAMVFFHSSGPILIAAWIFQLFADTASSTIANAYSAELFPTSYRSTAASALNAANTLGRALGLLLESWLYRLTGSHWTAISCLLLFWMIPGALMLLFFPETAGQELEAISPEAAVAAGN